MALYSPGARRLLACTTLVMYHSRWGNLADIRQSWKDSLAVDWYPTKQDMQALRDQLEAVCTESFYVAQRQRRRAAVCAGHWAARQGLSQDAVLKRTLRNVRRWERRPSDLTPMQRYLLRGDYEAILLDAWRAARADMEAAV